MYVALDDKTEAVLGVVNELRPGTHGLPLSNPAELRKTVTERREVRRTGPDGEPLFVDAHGVVSARPIGKPAVVEEVVTREVDVLHDPAAFTAEDVLAAVVREHTGTAAVPLRGGPVDVNCVVLDNGLRGYVDLKLSKNIGLGSHRAEIAIGGELVLLVPEVPSGTTASVVVEADGNVKVGAGKSLSTAKKSKDGHGAAGKRGLVVHIGNAEQRTTAVHLVAVNW